MKHIIILLFVFATSVCSAADSLKIVKDSQGRDRFETRYRITPKPADLGKTYSLYWDYSDRLSGNAALYYEQAYAEMCMIESRRIQENGSDLLRKIWDKTVENPPLDKTFLVENTVPFARINRSEQNERYNFTCGFYNTVWDYCQPEYFENFDKHLDETKKFVEEHGEVFKLMERGSRCDSCDLGISYRESSDVASELNLTVQHLRSLARLLTVKIRLEIHEGRYDDAVKSAQIGMEMAKHIGDQPTLICPLVGIAIHGIMHADLMELLDRPDAPNLYWAVTNRPNPYFNFWQSVQAEKAMLYQMFPLLKKAVNDPNSLSDGEWELFCKQADQMIKESMEEEAKNVPPGKQVPIIDIGTAYPSARDWLKRQGKTEAEIDALSREKAVGLQAVHDIQIVFGDRFNAVYLPIWESLDDPEEGEPFFFRKSLAQMSPYARIFGGQFGPAIDAGRKAFRRVQLQNDTLRISQALRIYMAEHDGKLPASLDEIKSVPIPCIDPYTGKPFRYRLDGGVGIIEVPEHNYPLTIYFEPAVD